MRSIVVLIWALVIALGVAAALGNHTSWCALIVLLVIVEASLPDPGWERRPYP